MCERDLDRGKFERLQTVCSKIELIAWFAVTTVKIFVNEFQTLCIINFVTNSLDIGRLRDCQLFLLTLGCRLRLQIILKMRREIAEN